MRTRIIPLSHVRFAQNDEEQDAVAQQAASSMLQLGGEIKKHQQAAQSLGMQLEAAECSLLELKESKKSAVSTRAHVHKQKR